MANNDGKMNLYQIVLLKVSNVIQVLMASAGKGVKDGAHGGVIISEGRQVGELIIGICEVCLYITIRRFVSHESDAMILDDVTCAKEINVGPNGT